MVYKNGGVLMTSSEILEERAALLAMLLEPGASWSDVAERVEISGSARTTLEESASSPGSLFGTDDNVNARVERARELLGRWTREGIHFASLLDSQYPQQLLTVHQRPPFVTWLGTASSADRDGVAIVGTRQATPRGVARARELARGLAERAVTVVSGLAAGIDAAAHRGALDAGGRTVAVLGTGVRWVYPRENHSLQAEIARTGMVLSQFLPDSPPTRSTFPMRNAVMSGFSAATVVVEAAGKSGARMQARLALEHGRPVFLMSELLAHDWARGYAERPGVAVVNSVDDVMRELEHLETSRKMLIEG